MNYEDYNLTEILFQGKKHSKKIVIFYKNQKITYKELYNTVNQFSAFFFAQIKKQNETAIVLLKDSPLFFYTFLGLIKVGIIPILLHPKIRPDRIEYIIKKSNASFVIYTPDIIIKDYSELIKKYKQKIKFLELNKSLIKKIKSLRIKKDIKTYKGPDDPCLILCTSGTTGEPKLVVHSHKNYIYCAQKYGRYILGIRPRDCLFSCSKLFFAYGLGNSLIFPLYFGATVILSEEKLKTETIIKIIKKYHPTIFFAVPTIYNELLNRMDNFTRTPGFKNIRIFVSAGENLSKEIGEKWFNFTKKNILDGLGTTEMANTFLSNKIDDYKLGSTGKPVPGYKIKLLNNRKNECKVNEVGDLFVKGESCFLYYLKNTGEMCRVKFDGWVRTFDKFIKDANGYYYYCGRTNELFKKNAQWISPLEIENCILSLREIKECAAIKPPESNDIILFIVLENKKNKPETIQKKISEFIEVKLGANKIPRKIYIVNNIPKTETGKKQRHKLVKLLEQYA